MKTLDFRSKLIVFLSTVFLVAVLSKNTVFYLLSISLFAYLSLQGYGKMAIRYFSVLILVTISRIISDGKGYGVFLPEMFLFIITRTIVILMSVTSIMKTPPGELIAVMKKMRINRNISLPLVFMMRFFPIVKSEFREIFDSLKLRGLFTWKKPIQMMEYVFVPMMFSASKIAEELAAAAEVRGISAVGKHTSRRTIKFKRIDTIVVVVTVFSTAIFLYMEKVVIQ